MAGPTGLSSRGEHFRKHRCEGNAIEVWVKGCRPCHHAVVRTPPNQSRTKSTTCPLYFQLITYLGFCAVESLAHVPRGPGLSFLELFTNSCCWRSNYYWKEHHVGWYRRGTALFSIQITLFIAYWWYFSHPCSERKRRTYKPGESGSLSQQEHRRRQWRRHLQSDHKESVRQTGWSFRSDFVLAVLRRRPKEKIQPVIPQEEDSNAHRQYYLYSCMFNTIFTHCPHTYNIRIHMNCGRNDQRKKSESFHDFFLCH